MTILPYICNFIMGFVSNCLKAFKLQMVAQAPTSATASSNYYLGPLDQRPSIWGLGKMLPQQFRDHAPNENDVPFQELAL